MKEILIQISRLRSAHEKEILSNFLDTAKKYIRRKDTQSLEVLILRLNGYHDSFSSQAQIISQKLAKYIMEAVNKK